MALSVAVGIIISGVSEVVVSVEIKITIKFKKELTRCLNDAFEHHLCYWRTEVRGGRQAALLLVVVRWQYLVNKQIKIS